MRLRPQPIPIVHASRRFREGVDALEALGGIVQPMITARVDYQEAIRCGLGPTEVNPNGEAAEEIRQLWLSVRRRLTRLKLGLHSGQRAA